MHLLEIVYRISETSEKSQDFFLKYLPIISPVIVVGIFIFNNRYDRKNKKREAKRSWYFKAYFEPNIKKIDAFFSQADLILENGLILFNKNLKTGLNSENYKVIASTLGELSKLKRKFYHEVIGIINPEYPEQSALLSNLLLDFEDAGSDVFNDINKNVDDHKYFVYVAKMSEIKGNIIRVMSIPAL